MLKTLLSLGQFATFKCKSINLTSKFKCGKFDFMNICDIRQDK